jgi:selenocysteine lyase/cysteine desulfurase
MERWMNFSRRAVAKVLGAAAFGALTSRSLLSSAETTPSGASKSATSLPDRAQFVANDYQVSLNNARWHPMSKGSQAAIDNYLEYKRRGIWNPPDQVSAMQKQVRDDFAALIHANPSEIAYVGSTTAGETMFVAAMGFPALKGNIVTDALHFEGSLYLYEALAKQGVDVRVVRPRDWRIPLDDIAAVVDKETRLVAVSKVSFINGFEHDLKPLCDLAHAHGALVYADAVQAVGCMPIDVRTSGVDALGAASYKWLMGDMGLGFLYVRQQALGRLHRVLHGYRQLEEFSYHVFPWDTPGTYPIEWKPSEDAAGYFEIGTIANAAIAALSFSLPWLRQLGMENVQVHAQQLNGRLRAALPSLGYPCITPAESKAPIICFGVSTPEKTADVLRRAHIDVSLSPGRMRVSPSVYNTIEDVDRLIAALS